MSENNNMERYKLGIVGGEQLMSHTEMSLNVTQQKVARDLQLADGSNVREVIAIKRLWSWSYNKLPGEIVHTADDGLGYNDLILLFEGSDQLSLLVPDQLANYEQVPVLISQALSGQLTRRSPWVLWESVNFSLLEV